MVLLIPRRYEACACFQNQGWELDITARACFHVCARRVAILTPKLPCFLHFTDTNGAAEGPWLLGSAGCRTWLFWYRFITQTGGKHWCTRADFLQKHSHEWKMNTHIHACKHKHWHLARPHTPHAVSGFHVLCPNFWLVPTSKQARGACLLPGSE